MSSRETRAAATDAEGLEPLRDAIDEIDAELVTLLNRRAELASRVGELKRSHGERPDFYRPEREARVLRRAIERNPGPLHPEEVARLLREVMSACLAAEQPLRVGFLGPEGTFTQAATLKHFGHSIRTQPLASVEEVFRDVESGDSDFGVVPIENSIEGVVDHTLDMFLSSPLKVCGEVELRIHHCLLANGTDLAAIEKVYAHQQGLAQCRHWLGSKLPGAAQIPVASNADGAQRAAADPTAAAIASDAAAELYGLQIIAANIEDQPDNTTRFLVIGQRSTPPSGDDKTSLLFSTANKPGALYRVLGTFAEHGISMTRIESRPSRRGIWDYVFFVDIEGHTDDAAVAQALQALENSAAMVKVLGSYPRAVL